MATLLLFGPARSAAGQRSVTIDALSVVELCDAACRRFGPEFEAVLRTSAVWVNGEPVTGDPPLGERDEVAVLPPVSGGA
ncbi:MAG TPA: MoaD/ThiS family protein [Acidimicrobiales bacterium]|nr:MoaD/ThiS family protein [Acidimicrobiales bacterium]